MGLNTDNLTNYQGKIGYFPPQKVKKSEKNDAWGIACINAIASYLLSNNENGKSSLYDKELNYKLVNGYIDLNDVKHVTDPFNVSEELGGQPAKLQNYNKIYPKINYLTSKEYDAPFNFKIFSIAGGGFNSRNEFKKQQIVNNIHSIVQNKMIELGMLDPSEAIDGHIPLPELDKYMKYSYVDIREKFLNTLLKDIYQKEQLQLKFNQGFFDANVVAQEVYNITIVNGLPKFRKVNPRYFEFIKTVDLTNIEDSQACVEISYMDIGSIIDEFGEYLNEEEIERLENNLISRGDIWGRVNLELGLLSDNNHNNQKKGIPVIRTSWKSLKMIHFIKYLDENGEIQETIIDDDTWSIPKDLKSYVLEHRKEWIVDIFEGVRIDVNKPIYVYVRPVKNQIEGKLPYVGTLYNNVNSEAKSTVDFLKPYQYMIDIILYRLELELAKADGKKVMIDVAMLPKSQGIGMKEFMYYAKNMGYLFINSAEEGLDVMGQHVNRFNQMTSFDLTLSNTIGQYINIIDKFESMMDEIVGISRQSQGEIAASETATGVNRAITQTTVITRPLFIKHNDTKRRAMDYLLQTAKLCMIEGKYKVSFMDDIMKEFLEIDGELLNDSEYSLYLTDSTKENESFEALKNAAQLAVNNGEAELKDLAYLLRNNSMSEVYNYLNERSEQKAKVEQSRFEQEQQQIQAQIELDKSKFEKELQFKYDELENNSIEAQLDRESKLQEASIKAMSFSENQDINNNGIPDIAEQTRLSLEASKQAFEQSNKLVESKRKDNEVKSKYDLEKSKLTLERERLKQEKELKQEELKVQRENMKNDEKIEKLRAKNRKTNSSK